MTIVLGVLLQLLGMGALGSLLLFISWTQLLGKHIAETGLHGWRFDKGLLVRLGISLMTLGTMTLCYNRASVVWLTRLPPPGPLLLQFAAMTALVAGVMSLLWLAGLGRRIWALALFWAGSSAWSAVVMFWSLGYVGAR